MARDEAYNGVISIGDHGVAYLCLSFANIYQRCISVEMNNRARYTNCSFTLRTPCHSSLMYSLQHEIHSISLETSLIFSLPIAILFVALATEKIAARIIRRKFVFQMLPPVEKWKKEEEVMKKNLEEAGSTD